VSVAHVQGLWLTAYLDNTLSVTPSVEAPEDLLPLPQDAAPARSIAQFRWEATLHARYCKWRYPRSFGDFHPDFAFDLVPYMDLMLREMGLNTRRKKGSFAWLKDVFIGYIPEDYQTVVEEWEELLRAKGVDPRRRG
jgi:hypothetical protein